MFKKETPLGAMRSEWWDARQKNHFFLQAKISRKNLQNVTNCFKIAVPPARDSHDDMKFFGACQSRTTSVCRSNMTCVQF